ncbi:DNA-binding helix-turn-helix protein [Streptococcus mitis bv. 2 str. SK95]|uniref:DNA-binding helix-turn-helix protein n=1 Tax=Streptococcus mitis bv. 2 str. SK95 TaxID=1000588 RepID=F9LWX1_STROR|nr:helix-turn-helix transcriptional regulator [Streptococcus mitis]EGU66160.1 DNA-binding helix-turn-helix protein [Streptococcus mitis bv. 2 str. SK95]
MNKLANNIKSLRLSMGETQEDLAYALDLNSKSAVANWESGDNVPSSENLHRISNRYGVTIDQLMNDDLTSEFSFIKYFCNVNSADELIKLFMNLFPVILLESEKSNLKLVEAIECQKNLKICMIRGDNQEEFDFYYDKTSYIYMELIDKEESVSANANLVSMFLLCAFYNRIGKEWDGIQDCFEFSNKSLRKKN